MLDTLKITMDFKTVKYGYFSFLILFSTVLSQWDFSDGKFGLLSPGKASCNRVVLPNLLYMLVLVFP